jgi:hypothetical protein
LISNGLGSLPDWQRSHNDVLGTAFTEAGGEAYRGDEECAAAHFVGRCEQKPGINQYEECQSKGCANYRAKDPGKPDEAAPSSVVDSQRLVGDPKQHAHHSAKRTGRRCDRKQVPRQLGVGCPMVSCTYVVNHGGVGGHKQENEDGAGDQRSDIYNLRLLV